MEIEKFSKFFEHKILTQKQSDDFKSINFLISAKWGRGKTKLKNDFKNFYEKKEEWLIFDINIWLNNFKSIDEILFIEFIKYIRKSKELSKYKVQIWKIIKNIFSSIVEKNEIISFLNEIVIKSKDFGYKKIIDEINDNYKTFFALEELINFVIKNLKKEKIIFLYDELDRCDDIFIRDFFSKIKQLFNYENVVHIVFANENYINEIFCNLNSDEKFIDKYFNNVYKIKPNIVEAIEEKWTKTSNFDDKLFEYYDYKSSKYKKFKINKLFLHEISYRDFNKYETSLSNFLHNIDIFYRKLRNTPLKNNSILYWFNEYDDIAILFIIFLILKGYNEIDDANELKKIIDEYSIVDYFDFDNYRTEINNWLTLMYQNEYGVYNENNSNAPKMKKIDNEQDFLFALAIQIKKITIILINEPFVNINQKFININIENEIHININKLLNLANKQ